MSEAKALDYNSTVWTLNRNHGVGATRLGSLVQAGGGDKFYVTKLDALEADRDRHMNEAERYRRSAREADDYAAKAQDAINLERAAIAAKENA
jgi:hypothetical protein